MTSKTNKIIGFSVLGFIVIMTALALIFGKTDEGVSAAAHTSALGFILAGVFYAATVVTLLWGLKNQKTVSLPDSFPLLLVVLASLGTMFLLNVINV